MATRETRADRGRQRGNTIQANLLQGLRRARMAADVSQRELARLLGWSQAEYWRFEHGRASNVSLPDLAATAAILGHELSANLYPDGDPIADRGHQALIARFRALLSPAFQVVAEVPLPNAGDRRSWDLLLRLDYQLIGVEAETRIRDVQAVVRRIRSRERDGGADEVLLVLSASATNRLLLDQLLLALGTRFAIPSRSLRSALRAGRPLLGSGVILV